MGYDIERDTFDLPEIQSMDPHEIMEHKIAAARNYTDSPFIIEDTGLYFNALNGFPGPLIKWPEKCVGPEGLYRMLHTFPDKSASVRCFVGLGNIGEPKVFEGRVHGTIVEPAGDSGFGFDYIFKPDGHHRRYSEMSLEEKNRISHRKLAFDGLKKFLDENGA